MRTIKRLIQACAVVIPLVVGQRLRKHVRSSVTQSDVRKVIASALDDVPAAENNWNQMIDETLYQLLEEENVTATGTTPLFPHLVCHAGARMTGAARAANVGTIMGIPDTKSLCAVQYNKDDMTCLICDLPRTDISTIKGNIYAVPIPSILKMQKRIHAGLDSFKRSHSGIAAELLKFSVQLSPRFELLSADAWAEVMKSTGSSEGECSVELEDISFNIVRFKTRIRSPTSQAISCIKLLIEAIAKHPFVWAMERHDHPTLANVDAQWILQSNIPDDRPFFSSSLTGSGQVIAVSDSGLDLTHCYFKDSDDVGPIPTDGTIDLTRRKVVLYDVDPGNGDGIDHHGHGTHVSGTAAGRLSVDGIVEQDGLGDGTSRGAKIAFFDIWAEGGPLGITNLYNTFDKGRTAGAQIHSASWRQPVWNGGQHNPGANEYTMEAMLIDRYMYENDEFLFIVSAGNEGYVEEIGIDLPNTVGTPGTAKNTVTVGACDNFGIERGQQYLAYFSSRGPTADGRTKPEIVGPGHSLQSAQVSSGCGLIGSSGTSMAAPAISGTAAQIRQYFEEGWYPSGERVLSDSFEPSGALVKAVLLNGGEALLGIDNLNLGVTPSAEYDNHQNFGRSNLLHSLPLRGQNSISAKVMDRQVIRQDEGFQEYKFITDSESGCNAAHLSATLVWVDPPPATPGCTECVLNDLDLSIVNDKDGTTFFPNGLSGRDATNNAERVRVTAVHNDMWSVRVVAHNLISTETNYALVVTGCFDAEEEDTAPPSHMPSNYPSSKPSSGPSDVSSSAPTSQPSSGPSEFPSGPPTAVTTLTPSAMPSHMPSTGPSENPSNTPSSQPSVKPTTEKETEIPTVPPSNMPSRMPSTQPSDVPSSEPSEKPSNTPSSQPSFKPTAEKETEIPTVPPSNMPSCMPSTKPSDVSSLEPSEAPSNTPSSQPSFKPTPQEEAAEATDPPSSVPSSAPSSQTSSKPTLKEDAAEATAIPSIMPSSAPSPQPTSQLTTRPTELWQESTQPFGAPKSTKNGKGAKNKSAKGSKITKGTEIKKGTKTKQKRINGGSGANTMVVTRGRKVAIVEQARRSRYNKRQQRKQHLTQVGNGIQ